MRQVKKPRVCIREDNSSHLFYLKGYMHFIQSANRFSQGAGVRMQEEVSL